MKICALILLCRTWLGIPYSLSLLLAPRHQSPRKNVAQSGSLRGWMTRSRRNFLVVTTPDHQSFARGTYRGSYHDPSSEYYNSINSSRRTNAVVKEAPKARLLSKAYYSTDSIVLVTSASIYAYICSHTIFIHGRVVGRIGNESKQNTHKWLRNSQFQGERE